MDPLCPDRQEAAVLCDNVVVRTFRKGGKNNQPHHLLSFMVGMNDEPPPAHQEGALTGGSPTAAGGWLRPEVPWAGEGAAGSAPGSWGRELVSDPVPAEPNFLFETTDL